MLIIIRVRLSITTTAAGHIPFDVVPTLDHGPVSGETSSSVDSARQRTRHAPCGRDESRPSEGRSMDSTPLARGGDRLGTVTTPSTDRAGGEIALLSNARRSKSNVITRDNVQRGPN